MIGIAIVLLLNLAFGAWVVRLIVKDPANLRKRRDKPVDPTDPPAR
ncbi:hypothetical protein FHS79_001907 [Polymorphobacter multimanifer]|uniref:Uncharacterized protein n=1 Tax=Polymorphobacter multimanifer TaxID=1070431 RepID=A0A841LFH9_9SPHN|nr:hypothetical protein [Polymorphobacter multimanifer]MBB6227728.1 hypothetical protein [Polymorphobacter multimanifer]